MPFLRFYAVVTEYQASVAGRPVAGWSLGQVAEAHLAEFLALVADHGPPVLGEAARAWSAAPYAWDRWWETREAGAVPSFFFKTFAQPWAELRAANLAPRPASGNRCPACGGPPQVGLLRSSSEGAPLFLSCAICSTCWPFPRIACTACPERDPAQLALLVPVGEPLVRIHTCETCRSYLKIVDLGVDGRAVPVVDELASVALDAWAREGGYTKVEPNLAGV